MVAAPAPPPDTLRWGDVGIPRSHAAPLHGVTVVAIAALTVSYVAPVTALAGLANLGAVAALVGYPPLVAFAARPAVGVVQGALSPLLLSLLMGLVPAAVRAIVRLRRLACAADLDAAALGAHVAFEATTTLGVVLAAGALIPAAAALVSSPPAALGVLAAAASTQGLFYINYVLTQVGWALPLVLLDPGRLVRGGSPASSAATASPDGADGADGALSRLFVGGLDALVWAAAVRHALMVGMYLLRAFWPGVATSVALLGGGVAARRVVINRYGPVARHGHRKKH
ncbi:hypothetical protein I4F81_006249 [Pyropia yezoensis]|uniref:Uncharacterized protein n=1 Tax=Pyropia yezoensis TaxID=2788 RepID=A0ACC3C0P2_PYRYE|nr:hypothetical protein I4F81_006249 [Neopyropia yezoensis]